MNVKPKCPWPARDEELRGLWGRDKSTMKIAAIMGLTKNQIVGRAHRLKLMALPTPISASVRRPVLERDILGHIVWAPHLDDLRARIANGDSPAMVALAYGCSRSTARDQMAKMGVVRRVVMRQVVEAPVYVASYVPPKTYPAATCQFPLWGMGRSTGRFCDAPSVSGFSYCQPCKDRCYPARRAAEACTPQPGSFVFAKKAA